MKCSKCKVNERHGSLAYCSSCNAEYMKAYREAKKGNMEKPVMIERVEPTEELVEPKDPLKPKPKEPIAPSLVYWSFYVTPGSDIQKQFLEIEKSYQVA